ncbi:LysM peptidoglycan-binding domain-containing protein [Fulvivirga maritima]|uniref:CIS tube protein n=1 Tax=Fulvivirga maritima TaxID=2904247 RepID=UPI001F2FCB93|nr:LysM peptidoglycan-binding domain-containing protein [Fulvivirga maritima]UII24675.1 LysM peptidoglycan-binding domain-containing protein [Fulvivirga maritima]
MNPLNLFKLEKLKIKSYSTAERNDKPKIFEAMFNPESYSLHYENKFNKCQGVNTTGGTTNYSFSRPEKLSLKLILDGTGASVTGYNVLLGKTRDVYNQVQEFLRLTTFMDGDIHEPPYLLIIWGDLNFKCRLTSLDIKYTLFDRSGVPLRAELDTSFFGQLEETERLKNENKNSPDLTHIRVVKAEDQLPLMCEQIYGSPHYYISVAKANGITDFRNLKPGQEIFFPPIEK